MRVCLPLHLIAGHTLAGSTVGEFGKYRSRTNRSSGQQLPLRLLRRWFVLRREPHDRAEDTGTKCAGT